jgi:NAD(P)-dependent dehydrogenase (short-subunit alcohol dehydrogenase family)
LLFIEQGLHRAFAGRTVAVVGGGWKEPGGSIGGATCRLFARREARVAVVDNDTAAAAAAVELIERAGGEAVSIIGDAATSAGCAAIVGEVVDRFGGLDVLVNNIGISARGGLLDVGDDDWDRVMAVNLKSVLYMFRAAHPHLKGGGAVVNLSSIAADRPPPGGLSYAASKVAIESLTRAIALDHGLEGIRANCVRPGELATWRVLEGAGEDALREIRDRVAGRSVLGTVGGCWDIAGAIAFLASDDARWITGQVLTVDGGAGFKRAELWPVSHAPATAR